MKNKKLKKLQTSLKKHTTSFKPSKTFIAITSLLLGIGGTVLAQNFTKEDKTHKIYHLTSPYQEKNYHPPHAPRHNRISFDDDFFGHSIFEEMHAMQREMDRHFYRQQARMDQLFHQAKRLTIKESSAEVTQRQTENEYIYELKFRGYQKEDIEVLVKNQTLILSASNKENKDDMSKSSNFYYSFYLPEYNNKTKPLIKREKEKITVILKK